MPFIKLLLVWLGLYNFLQDDKYLVLYDIEILIENKEGQAVGDGRRLVLLRE